MQIVRHSDRFFDLGAPIALDWSNERAKEILMEPSLALPTRATFRHRSRANGLRGELSGLGTPGTAAARRLSRSADRIGGLDPRSNGLFLGDHCIWQC